MKVRGAAGCRCARRGCQHDLHSEKVRVIDDHNQKTSNVKNPTRNSCMSRYARNPPKVSCEGTQLEVARGQEFCKAACRIENVGRAEIGWGQETGGLGIFFQRAILRAPTAIALSASRCWRWPIAGSDNRRSVRSRRAMGLRGSLRKTPFGLEWRRIRLASADVARTSTRPLTSAHDE